MKARGSSAKTKEVGTDPISTPKEIQRPSSDRKGEDDVKKEKVAQHAEERLTFHPPSGRRKPHFQYSSRKKGALARPGVCL